MDHDQRFKTLIQVFFGHGSIMAIRGWHVLRYDSTEAKIGRSMKKREITVLYPQSQIAQ